MRSNRKYAFLLACILTVLLSACAPKAQVPENTIDNNPVVENLFTAPVESAPENLNLPSQSTEEATSSMQIAPTGEALQGATGPYRIYGGGQFHIPYSILTTGSGTDQGIGLLFFLDGRPQPYQVGENGQTENMHVFYPTDGVECIADIYFTPITGQQGDMLELYALALSNPDHSLSDGVQGFSLTHGACASGTQLKLEASPPESAPTGHEIRLTDLQITYEDTKYGEIGGWSEMELMERVESHTYVNGVIDTGESIVYGVSSRQPVTLRYELWGSPYVRYGLVWFVDNVPVFSSNETLLSVQVRSGQKTVIEAALDMTGFDGESVVYAILVPRNYRSSEVLTMGFLDAGRTFYLVGQEK